MCCCFQYKHYLATSLVQEVYLSEGKQSFLRFCICSVICMFGMIDFVLFSQDFKMSTVMLLSCSAGNVNSGVYEVILLT